MSKRWIGSVAASLCLAGAAWGQAAPQWYFLVEETVKPSMTEQYETATKQMIEAMRSHQIDPAKVNFSTISGEEMGYIFVIPMKDGFASMDEMMGNWQAAVASMGEDWERLDAKASAAVEKRASFHVVRREDLSYHPEDPAVPEDEVRHIFYGFHYVIPGKEQALEEVARKFAELYKRKGIKDGWTMYQSVTGSDLPLYVVAHAARGASDHYARQEEIWKSLGADAQKLFEQAMACTRRLELKDAMLRPDLSYPSDN